MLRTKVRQILGRVGEISLPCLEFLDRCLPRRDNLAFFGLLLRHLLTLCGILIKASLKLLYLFALPRGVCEDIDIRIRWRIVGRRFLLFTSLKQRVPTVLKNRLLARDFFKLGLGLLVFLALCVERAMRDKAPLFVACALIFGLFLCYRFGRGLPFLHFGIGFRLLCNFGFAACLEVGQFGIGKRVAALRLRVRFSHCPPIARNVGFRSVMRSRGRNRLDAGITSPMTCGENSRFAA